VIDLTIILIVIALCVLVPLGCLLLGFRMGRVTQRPMDPAKPKQYNPGPPALADQDPFAMAMEPGTKEAA
jgi:hypothetical protein